MKSVISKKWILVLSLLISSCGGAGSGLGETGDNGVETSDLQLAGMIEFAFDQNHLPIDQIDPDKNYLVSLYAGNSESNNEFAYGLGSSSLNGSQPKALTADRSDATHDFHEELRLQEAEFDTADLKTPPMFRALAAQANLEVGSERNFKVISDMTGNDFTTVNAVLIHVTSDYLVYVDERNLNAFDDGDLDSIFSNFSKYLPQERQLFGRESDVNGDGRFAILMSQAINELGEQGGGMLTGFFYAADLYDADLYPVSNEMEVFYTLVPDPKGDFGVQLSKKFTLSNVLPAVLPHEFQHMVNYNERVIVGARNAESSFLNEGLSHLAEDIYSVEDGYMPKTGVENAARVAGYLSAVHKTCFTCGSSLNQRGGIYLFLRYFYEQAEAGQLKSVSSGAEWISRLVHSQYTGVANILNATLNDTRASRFRELMAPFSAAIYLSNSGLTDDARFQFKGLSLRGKQADNRGTVLNGPKVLSTSSLPYLGSLNASSATYVEVTGAQLLSADDQGVPFVVSADMQGGGYFLELSSK